MESMTHDLTEQAISEQAGDAEQAARVTRNAAAIAISTLLARGLQFGWAILLAQLLSDAAYGTWGVIGGMITIAATLPEFGMGLIVLRDVARDRTLAGRYLGVTLIVQPLLAIVAYVLLVSAGLVLPYDTTTRALLVLAAISLLVDTLGNMGYNQLLAAEQMVTTSAILVTHIALVIAFAFVALRAGAGLPGLYVGTICAGFFRVALHWSALRRIGVKPQFPFDAWIARHLFHDGLPIALASFFQLAYQHIDKILVFTLLGESDAGNVFSAFVIVFGVVELLNITILVALFPMMARLANDNPAALRRLTDRLAFLTLVVSLPVAVGISGLSARLAALLFPGYLSTSAVLEVLIWHTVVMMVGNAYSQSMVVQGRQTLLLFLRIGGLIINIALNVILLPIMGVQGAGVAILISYTALLAMFLAVRRPGVATFRALLWRSLRVCGAGAAMYACVLLLRNVNPMLAGSAGLLLYAGAIVGLRALAPDDWALIGRVGALLPVIGPRIVSWFGGRIGMDGQR